MHNVSGNEQAAGESAHWMLHHVLCELHDGIFLSRNNIFLFASLKASSLCSVHSPAQQRAMRSPAQPVNKDETAEFYDRLCMLGDSLRDQIQYIIPASAD